MDHKFIWFDEAQEVDKKTWLLFQKRLKPSKTT